LIVTWAFGLLALLVSALAAASRGDLSVAGNIGDSAVAEAAADGAAQQAVFPSMSGTWTADGARRRMEVGRATVLAQIEDQPGNLNPNFGTPLMLAALLGARRTVAETALDLARGMVDWRTVALVPIAGGAKLDRYRLAGLHYGPANHRFASLDEIGLILRTTPALLARLKPHVSVYQTADASTAAEAPFGRIALRDAELPGHGAAVTATTRHDQVVLIYVAAAMQGGTGFTRDATVALRSTTREGAQTWQILT
jgi:general secretion pathway protein K